MTRPNKSRNGFHCGVCIECKDCGMCMNHCICLDVAKRELAKKVLKKEGNS